MHKIKIQKEPPEVIGALDRLGGLQIPELREAVRANFLAQAACTRNDALTAAGFIGWNASVRVLREFLIPKGWIPKNIKNSPRITSPDGSMAIMWATGDEATGNPMVMPKTKSNKGTTTRTAINNNEAQIWLFSDEMIPHMMPVTSAGQSKKSTWVLLVYVRIDPLGNHSVRAELSLPVGMDESGRITAWSERIILPEITTDGDDLTKEPAEYAPEQEIIVHRKA